MIHCGTYPELVLCSRTIPPIRVLVKYLNSRVNLDAVRNRDVRVYISVRLSFMTYFDRGVVVAVGLPVTRFEQNIRETHTGITLPYDSCR